MWKMWYVKQTYCLHIVKNKIYLIHFSFLLSLLPFLWTDISDVDLAIFILIHRILISGSFIHTSFT